MVTSNEVLAAFERAAIEVVGELPVKVSLESSIGDLGIDSLSFIEMTLVIEDDLGVVLSPDDFDSIVTVNDAVLAILTVSQDS